MASKSKFQKSVSTEKKKRTVSAHKSGRVQTFETISDEEKKEPKIEEKYKKLMLAPPLLPKPKKI